MEEQISATMTQAVIEPFHVEQWMDAYEETQVSSTGRFLNLIVKRAINNIAETCAASISIDDICSFAGISPSKIFSTSKRLVYGSIRGSEDLRSNLAAIYNANTTREVLKDNILVANGAIGANFAVLYSLIGKGDHVICQHPTYQQLYSVPKSLGAEVDLWRTMPEDQWELDLGRLEQLIKSNSKMIILNNPQNPTGKIIRKTTFQAIVDIAKKHNLYLMVDEVYRPLFHGIDPSDPEFPPAALYWNYEKIVSTGSMSKAYSLAGIRLGWIASHSTDIIEACAGAREYTMISVSQLDDQLATIATGAACLQKITQRNIKLAQTNLEILHSFIQESDGRCEYVKPQAGTTALVKFTRDGKPVDDIELCKAAHKKGAFMVPGNLCFADGSDFRGYVRIGYVCSTDELEAGLKALEKFMDDGYAEVALAR